VVRRTVSPPTGDFPAGIDGTDASGYDQKEKNGKYDGEAAGREGLSKLL
jgi:hypothetical protein